MLYQIVCTSRSPLTRVVRACNPTHRGLKQFIGGKYRVIRGKSLLLPEGEILEHLAEIQAKFDSGMLALRTEDGREVNPHNMEVPPPLPIPPKPNFVEVVDVSVGADRVENVPAGIPQRVGSGVEEPLEEPVVEVEVVEAQPPEPEVVEGPKSIPKSSEQKKRRRRRL